MAKKKTVQLGVDPDSKNMDCLVHIGPRRETVDEGGKLILEILDKPAGDSVKIAAIEAVAKSLQPENVNMSYCNLFGGDQAVGSKPT